MQRPFKMPKLSIPERAAVMPPPLLCSRGNDRWSKKMVKEKVNTEAKVFEEKQPKLSRRIRLSKDGQWIIIETIRTDILHRHYMDAVLSKGV